MKKYLILLLCLWAWSACEQDDEIYIPDDSELITICCYDEFSDNFQTIQVNEVQLKRHLEHGDSRSPCSETIPPDEMH